LDNSEVSLTGTWIICDTRWTSTRESYQIMAFLTLLVSLSCWFQTVKPNCGETLVDTYNTGIDTCQGHILFSDLDVINCIRICC